MIAIRFSLASELRCFIQDDTTAEYSVLNHSKAKWTNGTRQKLEVKRFVYLKSQMILISITSHACTNN